MKPTKQCKKLKTFGASGKMVEEKLSHSDYDFEESG
jgi:hypothetical protein